MLKYKILNYDNVKMVVDVKVFQDEADIEFAKVLRLSLDSITDIETLEKSIYQTYMANLSTRERGAFSNEVEAFVTNNVDQVVTTSIPIPPGVVQTSVSDAVNVENENTSTVRVI